MEALFMLLPPVAVCCQAADRTRRAAVAVFQTPLPFLLEERHDVRCAVPALVSVPLWPDRWSHTLMRLPRRHAVACVRALGSTAEDESSHVCLRFFLGAPLAFPKTHRSS